MTQEDWREQFDSLRERAEEMEPGESKVLTLEEAARLAEAHGEVGLAYAVRDELIEAATFAGLPERALVAYAWCRGQQRKDPTRFTPTGLLWKQKWMVGYLSDFPHIGRKQIEEALDDVEQCFAKVGAGERAVFKLRYLAARSMGEGALAESLRMKWKDARRDHLTDCHACELNTELYHLGDKGEYALLLEQARPLLEKRHACAKVPHVTYGQVLYPLFKLGELERARDHHQRGYRMVRNDRYFVATVAEHLELLTLTANVEAGLKLLARHVEWTLKHATPKNRFLFHTAALALLERAGVEGRERVKLTLPSAFPLYAPEGRYETRVLRGWFEAQAEGLAAKFDARNGTDRFARLLARGRGLAAEVRPFSFKVSRGVSTSRTPSGDS